MKFNLKKRATISKNRDLNPVIKTYEEWGEGFDAPLVCPCVCTRLPQLQRKSEKEAYFKVFPERNIYYIIYYYILLYIILYIGHKLWLHCVKLGSIELCTHSLCIFLMEEMKFG